mmetsp:Transcript_1902/g.4269  ORF Transcript_1902/g.4269 Transcript_1902/m.4269 type:complete len:238 (+) Transcript_1902:93-806(+)
MAQAGVLALPDTLLLTIAAFTSPSSLLSTCSTLHHELGIRSGLWDRALQATRSVRVDAAADLAPHSDVQPGVAGLRQAVMAASQLHQRIRAFCDQRMLVTKLCGGFRVARERIQTVLNDPDHPRALQAAEQAAILAPRCDELREAMQDMNHARRCDLQVILMWLPLIAATPTPGVEPDDALGALRQVVAENAESCFERLTLEVEWMHDQRELLEQRKRSLLMICAQLAYQASLCAPA